MKYIVLIAALTAAAPLAAQMNAQPPGDGIDIHGHNPDGQAFTPPGYNVGVAAPAYAPAQAAPPGLIGGDYPPCSASNTDRCVQTYVKANRPMKRSRRR